MVLAQQVFVEGRKERGREREREQDGTEISPLYSRCSDISLANIMQAK